MLLLDLQTISEIVNQIGLNEFYLKLCEYLTTDFTHWHEFQKSSRHAVYVPNGVIELMPISNNKYYSFKYVNGHPLNPLNNKLNVVAFGVLSDVASGYPLMIASMTLLTAIRTAATSALASQYMARKESKRLAIIGCGAQSEFQVLAHHALFDLTEVYYTDVDPQAMQRFALNLKNQSFKCIPKQSIPETIESADIIVSATAAKGKQHVLKYEWLKPGQHISAIGGDSPGKTELEPEILKHSKIVVEYLPQTIYEGEIQNLGSEAHHFVYAELWELVSGQKLGRDNPNEITVFDSVGFSLEDFSALRLCYELAVTCNLGEEITLVPETLADCKNLYGVLNQKF